MNDLLHDKSDDIMNFDIPIESSSSIKVIGVGGGGGNAVNHMAHLGIEGVDFIVCNTDSQALLNSPIQTRIQLGASLTEGRGAGNRPEVGREAAIENIEDVRKLLANNTKMVFVTAGMGGGTGTGAAPIVAKAAKDMDILTVGIVTIPFRFEGPRRIKQALEGIAQIEEHVDSLLVINNEKLREVYGNLRVREAFSHADSILAIAAKSIAEIITVHGYVNVDFADVETVMRDSGVAIMGSAVAKGENRAIESIQSALNSPLLNNNDISGARNILINITVGDEDLTMDEMADLNNYVQTRAGNTADLIWGNGYDDSLKDELRVTVIATGFGTNNIPEFYDNTQRQSAPEQRIKMIEEERDLDIITERKSPNWARKPRIRKTESDENQTTIDFNSPADDVVTSGIQHIEQRDGQDPINKSVQDIIEGKGTNTGYNTSMFESSEIEYLEEKPAFLRKKIDISAHQKNANVEIERLSLSDTDDDFYDDED